ncbi:MAG: YIP1 family protein [Bacillota bacterium]|nr:YIP1 family protein [Bacillota bacterium]
MWRCLLGVLTTPGRAFEEIAERPDFLKSAFFICGASLLLALALLPKAQTAAIWMLEQNSMQIPPEQVEMLLPIMPIVTAVGSIVSALVAPWITWLLIACLLKVYSLVSTKSASFKVFFAASVFGYLPILIGGVITTAIGTAVPVENFQQVSLSLASFLPQQKGFLYIFLGSCNPFTWWSLILWGAGGAAAMKTRSWVPTAYLFGCWAIYAVLVSLLTFWKAPTGIG